MSLVAYASSSDEESDNEDEVQKSDKVQESIQSNLLPIQGKESVVPLNGHISDEDEYMPTERPLTSLLSLPKPKNPTINETKNNESEDVTETIAPIFARLPVPKGTTKTNEVIEEEDDEFLRKKATVLPDESIAKPPPAQSLTTRAPVKITIPSMKDFTDVDLELAQSNNKKSAQPPSCTSKKSGLLSVLPQAKSEQNFAKTFNKTLATPPSSSATSTPSVIKSLVPDTVRNRRPAHNTESVDGVRPTLTGKKAIARKNAPTKLSLVDCSDSDASDDEVGDFFSLNENEKLPEVNVNEINVMVAKRAAKIAESTTKYLESHSTLASESNELQQEEDEEGLRQAQKRYHDGQLEEAALQALVGGSFKRRRKQQTQIEIVDISSNQVLPDREEWMRTALASSTTYQPTGVLVDEEPAAGTRRKHQITYLAHKAKANEAELQAMWSANRQNRRATQSKYGF